MDPLSPSTSEEGKQTNITSTSNSPPAVMCSVRLRIPSSSIDTIIGPQREKIHEIQQQSQISIFLGQTLPHSGDQVIVLRGDEKNVCSVVEHILKLLEDEHNDKTNSKEVVVKDDENDDEELKESSDNNNNNNHTSTIKVVPNDVSITILIHPSCVGIVLGHNGSTAKQIEIDSGAHLTISECLPETSDHLIILNGEKNKVYKCFILVLRQLLSCESFSMDSIFHQYSPPIYVNNNTISPPHDPYFQPRTLGHHYNPSISESNSPIMMNERLMYGNSPIHMNTHHLSPPSNVHHIPQHYPANAAQKLAIPTSCAGAVIGRRGATIRDIRQESKTHISIADPYPHAPHERIALIIGSVYGVQLAMQRICSIIDHCLGSSDNTRGMQYMMARQQQQQQQYSPNMLQQQQQYNYTQQQPMDQQFNLQQNNVNVVANPNQVEK